MLVMTGTRLLCCIFWAVNYRLVQMTRSGCTVRLAWSKALTNACFSAGLIWSTFLLTGGTEKKQTAVGQTGCWNYSFSNLNFHRVTLSLQPLSTRPFSHPKQLYEVIRSKQKNTACVHWPFLSYNNMILFHFFWSRNKYELKLALCVLSDQLLDIYTYKLFVSPLCAYVFSEKLFLATIEPWVDVFYYFDSDAFRTFKQRIVQVSIRTLLIICPQLTRL